MREKAEDRLRFWAKVNRSGGPDACWEWTASTKSSGYGGFWVGGRVLRSHRVAYEIANGPIPEGAVVCHHCDNPPCCNALDPHAEQFGSDRPTFLSLFSGAGGLDLGLHRAGWTCVAQVEADAYRRSVLARHWPDIPQHDDVTTFNPEGIHAELIAGGFPCQDVSVAGRRAGLAGERTGLFWHALRIVESVRPRWVLLENVVGLLTSNGGRDFEVVVRALADVGYGVAWRVLDSRFFGVPQRRRRVFIVGALAEGRAGAERAGAVLAVGEGCPRHPAAGQEAGPEAAFRVKAGIGARGVGRTLTKASLVKGGHEDTLADYVVNTLDRQSGGPDDNAAQAGHLVPTVAATVKAHRGKGGGGLSIEETLLPQAFNWQTGGDFRLGYGSQPTALQKQQTPAVHSDQGVRRLTPTECCRLQGFSTRDHVGRIHLWSSVDALSAANDFQHSHHAHAKHAHATARIDLGLSVLALDSPGKCERFASDAEQFVSYPLPTHIAAIAAELVRMRRELGIATTTGRAASLSSADCSSDHPRGEKCVTLSGSGIEGCVKTAAHRLQGSLIMDGPSTTSSRGGMPQNYDSTLRTWCCSVVDAIWPGIAAMQPATPSQSPFAIDLVIVADDWFGAPNERPDGPRYAALGDAVTVNVAEWLGQRIAEAMPLAFEETA